MKMNTRTTLVIALILTAGLAHAAALKDDFEDGSLTDGTPLAWTPTSGEWQVVNSSSGDGMALQCVNQPGQDMKGIEVSLPEPVAGKTVTLKVRYSRRHNGNNDGNVRWVAVLTDENGNGYLVAARSGGGRNKFITFRVDNGGRGSKENQMGPGLGQDIATHVYRLEYTVGPTYRKLVQIDETTGKEAVIYDTVDTRWTHAPAFTRLELRTRRANNEWQFEEVSLEASP